MSEKSEIKSDFGIKNVVIIVIVAVVLVVAAQIQRKAQVDYSKETQDTPSDYTLPNIDDTQVVPSAPTTTDGTQSKTGDAGAVLGATNYSQQYVQQCGDGTVTKTLPRSAQDPNSPC